MTFAAARGAVAPYRGLAPFGDTELDALLFFGRERETEIATANLIASRLTVLYGSSGVGKTSLLRAGVARRVRELGARRAVGRGPDLACVVFSSWAGDPVRALADAVEAEVGALVSPIAPRPPEGASLADILEHWSALLDGDVCLVLDQLEEYFVYHDAGPLDDQLPEMVLRPELRANVMLSLRDDALARLDVFKGSIPNVFANHLRLDRLDRDAARAAILGPVERWNELVEPDSRVTIEPALVEDVLAQAASGAEGGRVEPPYLQLVMERMWNEEHDRGSRVLRQATLADLGGAAAIVREHLDRALAVLDKGAQEAAARMFEHLVTPSGTKIAHRASDLAQFARLAPSEADPVLGALGRERILRPLDELEGDRYEIFHDVLAQAILDWRRRRELEHERAVARGRVRRLAVLAGAAVLALVVMTGVSVYALSQRREARDRAAVAREKTALAQARAVDARAGRLAAQALGLHESPVQALRSALTAATLSPRHEGVLRTVLRENRLLAVADIGKPLADVKFVARGSNVLAAADDGSVLLVDSRTGKIVRRLASGGRGRHAALAADGGAAIVYALDGARVVDVTGRSRNLGGGVVNATFSPSRRTVVQTLRGDRVRVSDTSSGRSFVFDAPDAKSAISNRSGTRVLVIGPKGVLRMYDGRTGAFLFSVTHPGVKTAAAAFGPVGKWFATGGEDHRARIWDVDSGVEHHELPAHDGHVVSVAFSPRGTYLAGATTIGIAYVWRVDTGEHVSAVTEHTNFVDGVVFGGGNGDVIATWSRDGTARVTKANTGVPIALLDGHGKAVTGASFNANRQRLVTASLDGLVRVWDAQSQPFLAPLAQLRKPLVGVEFVGGKLEVRTADNKILVVDPHTKRVIAGRRAEPLTARSDDGSVVAVARGRAVDVRRGERRVRLEAAGRVADVAVSRDGRFIAAAAGKEAILWTTADWRKQVFDGHADLVRSVAFSYDGTRLLTAGRDHAVIAWRVADGSVVFSKKPQFAELSDAKFSPNGRWVVTAGPVTAGVLDGDTGDVMFLLQGHTKQLKGVTFDAAGVRIYTAALDGTIRTYRCQICGGLRELKALARARLAVLDRD